MFYSKLTSDLLLIFEYFIEICTQVIVWGNAYAYTYNTYTSKNAYG